MTHFGKHKINGNKLQEDRNISWTHRRIVSNNTKELVKTKKNKLNHIVYKMAAMI